MWHERSTAVACRSSSRLRTLKTGTAFALALAFALPACVTVRPEDKEYLANPAMTFGSGGESSTQETHVLTNREGSNGGGNISAGGCGCN